MDFSRALSEYERGVYEHAVPAFKTLARQGHGPAQYQLHRCYLCGNGVLRSERLARYWLLRAARSGSADAQERAGSAFREGLLGLKHSWAQARFWFQAAAAQDHPRALSQLGWMYFRGYGVTQDYKTALRYFTRAHELGDHAGTLNLAWFTERGLMVEQDVIRARALYEEAATKGNSHAKFNLGTLYKHGIGVEIDRQKARKLFREAAEMGDREAVRALKRMDEEDAEKQDGDPRP